MKAQLQKKQSINKLILFISEACNLRCKYCYVMLPKGAHDDETKPMMKVKTSRAIIRQLYSKYATCNFVQFFGGEPTLNMPAMQAIIDEILSMVREQTIQRPPSFGIVTNGASVYSQKMVDFCYEHNIGVTVSLDGFKHIHDALRPNAQHKGTFDDAIKTIKSLLKVNIPVAIETVYTSVHIDKKCSITDLLEFTTSLGVKKIILHTAYPPAPVKLCPFDDAHFERLRDYHVNAVDWWFSRLLNQDNCIIDLYFKDLLLPLLQGKGASAAGGRCLAGTHDLAIGPDGDVYSCHLLYKIPQFYLGNMLSEFPLKEEKGLPLQTDDLTECSSCFARNWCQPCGALNLSWGDAWTPPQRECELRRAVVLRIGQWGFKYLTIPENETTKVLRKAVLR